MNWKLFAAVFWDVRLRRMDWRSMLPALHRRGFSSTVISIRVRVQLEAV
jgi:hypothetical protein